MSVHHVFYRAGDFIGTHCAIHDGGGICRDDRHWVTAVEGVARPHEQMAALLDVEAAKEWEREVDPAVGFPVSARRILIRADERAPFGMIARLIEACSVAKLYKTDFAAQFDAGGGQFACWIPKVGHDTEPDFVDVRVELRWSESSRSVMRSFHEQVVSSDDELLMRLQEFHDSLMRTRTIELPLTIDATDRVPWKDAVQVLALARRAGFGDVEFAAGYPEKDR